MERVKWKNECDECNEILIPIATCSGYEAGIKGEKLPWWDIAPDTSCWPVVWRLCPKCEKLTRWFSGGGLDYEVLEVTQGIKNLSKLYIDCRTYNSFSSVSNGIDGILKYSEDIGKEELGSKEVERITNIKGEEIIVREEKLDFWKALNFLEKSFQKGLGRWIEIEEEFKKGLRDDKYYTRKMNQENIEYCKSCLSGIQRIKIKSKEKS